MQIWRKNTTKWKRNFKKSSISGAKQNSLNESWGIGVASCFISKFKRRFLRDKCGFHYICSSTSTIFLCFFWISMEKKDKKCEKYFEKEIELHFRVTVLLWTMVKSQCRVQDWYPCVCLIEVVDQNFQNSKKWLFFVKNCVKKTETVSKILINNLQI